MTELEKPSVILRREAEKPVPNWMRGSLYLDMPTNGHTETCRCQEAILWDYAVREKRMVTPYGLLVDRASHLASIWEAERKVFLQAVSLNDTLTERQGETLLRRIDRHGFFSKQTYQYLQRLAPTKLREVADHYEKHGL